MNTLIASAVNAPIACRSWKKQNVSSSRICIQSFVSNSLISFDLQSG